MNIQSLLCAIFDFGMGFDAARSVLRESARGIWVAVAGFWLCGATYSPVAVFVAVFGPDATILPEGLAIPTKPALPPLLPSRGGTYPGLHDDDDKGSIDAEFPPFATLPAGLLLTARCSAL
ncbi:hypothetical protein BC829DRAFT_390862, partial [Chytridium lagenaria]